MAHRVFDISAGTVARAQASTVAAPRGVRAKLAATRGESITEVLVALVVAGLAILMLAATISSAATVTKQGREAMAEYYALNNALVQASSSGVSGSAAADIATATGRVSLSATVGSGEGAQVVSLSFNAPGGTTAVANVQYVVSQQMRGILVASYDRASAPAGTGESEGEGSGEEASS